jgi:hypothetical protein
MKRIVWTFGLIAGAIMAVMLVVTIPLEKQIGGTGEVIGYTTMILAFLMVYFGIRTYRDQVMGGVIGFGRAFKVGLWITLIASACYVTTWEVLYYTVFPDFAEKYAERAVAKAKAKGETDAQVEARRVEMAKFAASYKNPVVNIGYTFLEVFPVGLIVVLVSAGILSRARPQASPATATA